MSIKVYVYKGCSTCQKALKFLAEKKISFESLPIVEHPPSMLELKEMLRFLKTEGKDLKNLFNTSGQQYRELKLAEKMRSGLSEHEALLLLSKNGKLIKRPFLLTKKGGAVGFNPSLWSKLVP